MIVTNEKIKIKEEIKEIHNVTVEIVEKNSETESKTENDYYYYETNNSSETNTETNTTIIEKENENKNVVENVNNNIQALSLLYGARLNPYLKKVVVWNKLYRKSVLKDIVFPVRKIT